MPTPYQIIVPFLALIALGYAWSLFMRGKKGLWEAVLWTFFWGGIALIALVPSLLSYLKLITGIQRQENAVIVTAIGILFFMIFSIVTWMEDLSQRQAKIVRELALRDAGLPMKDGGSSR